MLEKTDERDAKKRRWEMPLQLTWYLKRCPKLTKYLFISLSWKFRLFPTTSLVWQVILICKITKDQSLMIRLLVQDFWILIGFKMSIISLMIIFYQKIFHKRLQRLIKQKTLKNKNIKYRSQSYLLFPKSLRSSIHQKIRKSHLMNAWVEYLMKIFMKKIL